MRNKYFMKVIKSKKIVLVILLITVIFFFSINHFFSIKNKTEVLLIGIDGADWKVIKPLINEGKLPHIKELMEKGAWGNLESFPPLTSEVIWTSIATGKTPKKHGIVDLLMKDPDTSELTPPTSNLRKVKAIWNILSEYKKKVGIMGYRLTWPPEKVNGVMVSDRTDTNNYLSKDYSYPAFVDLCSEKEFKDFSKVENSIFSRIDKEKRLIYFNYSTEERDNFMANASKHLLQSQNFDFFSLYLLGTDVLSHHFWKYLFPEGFAINEVEKEKYKDIINDYYVYCDKVIGELLKEIDKNTTVIVVSDHGFRAITYKDYYIFSEFNFLLEVSGLTKIKIGSKNASIKEKQVEIMEPQRCLRIYSDLSEEEFEEIRKNAKEVLRNIRTKETNYPIFKILEDTKTGFIIEIDYNYINAFPEYHLLIQDKEYKILNFLSPYPFNGNHNELAVFIIYGKNIYQGKLIESSTIYDITPTILYLMGLPIGKDMKGKILIEAIDDNYLRKHPIRYINSYETGKRKESQKPIRSPQEEEKIKEMMRSLGYIN